ncbi:hypothetical protein Curi_c04430 [Gottschalkia acidurici 9a]|uniref:Uncharacterized protein n=1 Tax=Gottschalkia acidurici (strain ATCC 7906 / DSM 604 / BCRC 14475 / CIP 104303 / KCTC 5404 / NCIMB 10678 / 9a) TaxID=1128398 RepID=K0AUH6_GOTA9|nr:hypothetical protein [Gottschalkia acidurici]AFS77518.1 hypothetical protein Curi_c04430 [Gottschalkia acidurici 9a]
MGYVDQIFERATIKGIIDYLLYQEKTQGEDKDYEIRMDKAFEEFEKVALTYDDDRKSKLINSMNRLASEITDVYTEIVIKVGFLIMLDMMKKMDIDRDDCIDETSDIVYRKMYDSIFADVSTVLTLLQEKGSEVVQESVIMLRESQRKTEQIYIDFEK